MIQIFLLVKVTFLRMVHKMFLIFQSIFNTVTTPAGLRDSIVE